MYTINTLSDHGISELYKYHGPEEATEETKGADAKVLAFLDSFKDRPDYSEVEDLILNYGAVYERYGFMEGFKAAINMARWIMERPEGEAVEAGSKRAIMEYEAGQRAAKGEQ